jgi:exonuclease III
MQRWQNSGITVGSINVRGLSYLKLVALMEQDEFDVLCIQETWMAEPTDPPLLKGYKLLE